MSTKRILITGFGSFPKVEVNPSWEGVNSMKRDEIESKYNVQLYQKKVEVSYDHVDGSVPKLWDEHKPDLTIHVGAGTDLSGFVLETQANKERYDIQDCNKACPVDFKHSADGPDVITTDLDVDALCEEFNRNPPAEGLVAKKSDSAGKFLCEYIYYTSLCCRGCKKTLFVHVPYKGLSFELIAQGLERVLEACLKQLN